MKLKGRPRLVVTKARKHSPRYNVTGAAERIERDLWLGVQSLGKPVTIMPLNVEYSCEFGVCRRTASHLYVFRTDSLRLCSLHHKQLDDKWKQPKRSETR